MTREKWIFQVTAEDAQPSQSGSRSSPRTRPIGPDLVTLSGRVKTKAEEAKAISLAKSIKGVTDVKSTLQIEP